MKIADEFCRNRIVLAGDSAHLNSPSGGMGMNGGIHDALMLSDALELSLRANDETALPRYAAARRATALEDILQAADRNRSRMQEKEPGKRRDIFNELKTITEQTETARSYLLKTSMIEGLRKSEAQFRETDRIVLGRRDISASALSCCACRLADPGEDTPLCLQDGGDA